MFGVYLLAYLLLLGITTGLSRLGPLATDLAVNLWGINFIFSALTGIVVRTVMRRTGLDYAVDSKTLTRISGLSVDVMVAAAIGAISIVVVQAYLIPIIVLALLGGFAALLIVPWFCSRIFVDHQFHRTMMIFGVSTGTLPTGVALLRVIDPEFETPVASDYMYASGIMFLLAIPFIIRSEYTGTAAGAVASRNHVIVLNWTITTSNFLNRGRIPRLFSAVPDRTKDHRGDKRC